MAKKSKQSKAVETFTYDEASRKNIPTAEYQSIMEKAQQTPIRVAYERRNRDLDPQLVWRGKDDKDWSDLVVHAPPLYIQEKVHPKVLIDDLVRRSASHKPPTTSHQLQFDLFADFNGLPDDHAKTEFYQHDANWTNRMILGDSLQVMASLAEREGLRGQVQCIYLDPPYGIKFNSNFQWSTTSRDVKDGNTDHITREPEQVKAFRDTWRDGIHSYLTYLRDRLTVARDLLTDSGSIFVQIGDENVHRIRALMDEVFGEDNAVAEIAFKTTSSFTSSTLSRSVDFLLWYAKDGGHPKYRPLYQPKTLADDKGGRFTRVQERSGLRRFMTSEERIDESRVASGSCIYRHDNAYSQGRAADRQPFQFQEHTFDPWSRNSHWKCHYPVGVQRLARADRLALPTSRSISYVRFLDDFAVQDMANVWMDTQTGAFTDAKLYVVQTNTKVIERCILMASDPGDLVLDPTCGSGTAAYVAEQWGRRWITIDTSRVALALARARIMGARYPFYLLADSKEGQLKEAEITRTAPSEAPTHGNIRQGFVYERVPHITLKSIANNAEIDVIWEQFQDKIGPLLEKLTEVVDDEWLVASRKTSHSPLSTIHCLPLAEWEVPRDLPDEWPSEAELLHTNFWQARVARQREIDASIAAKADFEYLYDKPYEDKKTVRVAGPFTVESLSPHRTLAVNYDDELIDPLATNHSSLATGEAADFAQMVIENLQTSGVQQAHKEDKINFLSIAAWPGHFICAEARYVKGEDADGAQKRAGIFVGPEFGTVSRPDLVAAAREAGDADFDVLISCAFNYDAHSTEFDKLGRIPVLKARINADLHMADDLKNTGKGNLFVIFGEPDVGVVSGEWLVARNGRMIANYEQAKELSGLGSLAEINRLGGADLSRLKSLPRRGEVRSDQRNQQDAGRPEAIAAIEALTAADFPLSLTTSHYSQITVHGVDVFHPQTGEVRSDGAEGIACWFIDTDYNEESFFVRHAYFLGQNDPYKSLKTTLKAEINAEAWETLHSDTSRPFDKPKDGRIAVKVINHLGDEVMKVFRVP